MFFYVENLIPIEFATKNHFSVMACVLLGFAAEDLIDYLVYAEVAKDVVNTVSETVQDVSTAYHKGKKVVDTATGYYKKTQDYVSKGRKYVSDTQRFINRHRRANYRSRRRR